MSEFQDEEFLMSYDLTFVFGYALDGLTDNTHKADNAQTFYPLTRQQSKWNQKFELNEKFASFVDKYDTIILVAFGTTWMPRR